MTLEQLEADGDAHGYIALDDGMRTTCIFRRAGTTYALSAVNNPDKIDRVRRSLAFCLRRTLTGIEEAA